MFPHVYMCVLGYHRILSSCFSFFLCKFPCIFPFSPLYLLPYSFHLLLPASSFLSLAQTPLQPNMIITKQNRKLIYEHLFREGVLVAKKDYELPQHPEIEVPNLQVIKAMQSFNSKGFVKTQFSWQYYYYTLTPEGLDYLREYLHLPEEIVPATHKKAARPVGTRPSK